MATEHTKSKERYREKILNTLTEFFTSDAGGNEWVKKIANNAIAFPIVTDDGEDEAIKIVVSIPNGSRDGEPFDLDGEAFDYENAQKVKAEKKAKEEAAKKKKIEADKKKREIAKKNKEKREEEINTKTEIKE